MRSIHVSAALALIAVAAACTVQPAPANDPVAVAPADPAAPPATAPPPTAPEPAPSGSGTPDLRQPPITGVPARPGEPACKLAAPKKSEDSCSTDADCGVSQPCHAPACVAKAKSNPPTKDTMCTRILACESADANRCGCHEGRCALIPPT